MKKITKARQDYLSSESLNYIKTQWENTYESMQTRDASKEQLNEVYSHYNAFRKNSGLYLVDTQIMMTNMMAFKNKTSRKD